jgi:ABC-type sugar transport system substrate-binding protein
MTVAHSLPLRSFMLALLLAAATLAGCTREPEDQRIVLGFSQIGSESAWRKANTESIKSAAATSNIDLRFSDARQQQVNQIAAIRGFIAQKVDVIAFAPVVSTGWEEVLREARAAGIPVILTDRGVDADPSLYAGFLGSDFVEEGRKAARWVVAQFPDATAEVNIVELEGTAGAAPAVDRKKGFAEIIARHPNFRIIRSENGDFTRDGGNAAMAGVIASEKRPIHVLFAHNDDMALGAIPVLDHAGLKPGKDVLIVSIDAVRAAFEAMIAGRLNATVECNPLLGPQLMTSVTEVVAGRPIAKRAVVDEAVFTTENAKQFIQTRKY